MTSFAAYGVQRMPVNVNVIVNGDDAAVFPVLSLVTLTFDVWAWHSNSSEMGPNTSSVWIWRKSVQRFPTYLRHKQKKTKKVTGSAKNGTLLACGNNYGSFHLQREREREREREMQKCAIKLCLTDNIRRRQMKSTANYNNEANVTNTVDNGITGTV